MNGNAISPNISEEIDTKNILLLICGTAALVENAVRHGLRPKASNSDRQFGIFCKEP